MKPNSAFCVALLIALFCVSGCGRKKQPDNKPEKSAAQDTNVEATPTKEATKQLRVLGEVPAFALTDQDGQPFEKSELDGKIWVGTFIFTRCAATCPMQTAEMAGLQKELRKSNDLGRVHLVSFTVDPGFDTPEVLKKYGSRAKADFQHWHFLTGERGQLWDLSKEGFKLPVESARDEAQLINHSQFLILVDHESKIRGFYPALSQQAVRKLRTDLERLLDQLHPNRAEQVIELAVPDDVRAPAWLAERGEAQREAAKSYAVNCDFQFRDELRKTGITFVDDVVDDVNTKFKFAHYDHSTGLAVADVDNDGFLDIYFVSQLGPNELWRNRGDGTFEDITAAAGVAVREEVSVTASFADIDNDGDADLYLTRVRAANKLFLNDGSGRFDDVTQDSGLDHEGHSSGAVFFDYDRDGLLDLLLTNVGQYTGELRSESGFFHAQHDAFSGHLKPERAEPNILYRNLGGAKFQNVNDQLGFDDVSWTGDASPIDANDDGWPDLYLLNMQGHDEYYENQQGKGFVNKSRELFPVTAWGTMGIKVFDYNRDGKLDLYVTDMHTDMVHDLKPDEEKSKMRRNLPVNMLGTDGKHILGNAFYRKDGPDQFTEISDEIGAENYWPWGISVADLNADGFDDVFIAASMSFPYRYAINSVLLNEQGKRFVDSEFVLGVEPRKGATALPWMELDCGGADSKHFVCKNRSGKFLVYGALGTRSSVIFDIDNDGDLDIVAHDFGSKPMILTSNLQEKHEINYLKIELTGESSNRDGLGAMVTVVAGPLQSLSQHDGKSGYLSQSRMPLYFGLGDKKQIDRIEISWPSGTQQVIEGPIDVNQTLKIAEETADATN